MLRPVTVQLPERLYEQLKRQAKKSNRPIEPELVAAVENNFTEVKDWIGIPADIAEEIKQLAFLDDEHLWQAAKITVPQEKSGRMQELALKRQTEGLTDTEQKEAEQLLHFANRVMMVRAEAAIMLKNRGMDITSLELSAEKKVCVGGVHPPRTPFFREFI